MKRFTLILALVLMVAMHSYAERVTSETAQKVATTFLNNNGAKSAQLTDLSTEAGFPNLYIFNCNPGFVVMAADDCVQPILGYSLTGKFVAENMPDNVSSWLQGYNDEIQFAIDSKMNAKIETTKMWKELVEGQAKAGKANVVVNALVQTKWDQNGIYYYSGGQLQIFELYNNLCPYDYTAGERTVTGCAATAMAQIMKYWDYPSQGIGSHSYTPATRPDLGVQTANFGETTYQWADMPNILSMSSTTTQINAVATLMYHCGVSVNMMYNISGNGGSGAYVEDLPYALIHYFNYKATANIKYKASYSNDNWISLLKTELNASRPIEYNGRGSGGGHAFVCDGYDSNNNFHFNWGWSGNNDGFYALTNLVPGSGGSGGGSYNFSGEQCAIFGIEPSTTIPSPYNLTYTLSGLQDVTLNWGASNGATSYNVYRNNNLIGDTSSTTYTDTAPFGTNDYYIRALDSNGQQSLPSNTVTVTIDYPTPIVYDLVATLSGNDANLTWTAPEWCYPETPSATMNYGTGNPRYSWTYTYYGQRYLAADLAQYAGKAVYKISTYIKYPSTYSLYIYTNSGFNTYYYVNNDYLSFSKEGVIVSISNGWYDFELSSPIILTGADDLWVIMKQENTGENYPVPSFDLSPHNVNAFYRGWISNNRLYLNDANANYDCAWLISTYLTDGTYTYNLYDGTSQVASNINATNYTISNAAGNTVHRYTLKTNYYGGETDASNMAGLTMGNASLSTLALNANDKMTVTENSTLTVSGTLSDENADNLIFENGAQLVNNSTGVQATMKKNISGYTGDEGWYTISAPFVSLTPSADNGLISGSYDLYAYDEDGGTEGKEWINYKSGSFNLTPSSGYLYANSTTQNLGLSGELNSGIYSQTVNLAYNNSIESLKGFNLLGNPTAHEISFTKSADVADGYYYVDNGNAWVYSPNNIVPVGRGFLVKANATGQTVTLNPQSKRDNPDPDKSQYLCLSIGQDKAYVKLNEGVSMPLIDLNGNHSCLYFLRDQKPYVMLVQDNAETLDLCFESKHNGNHTITVDTNGLSLNYLHLIDSLTGNDVDLLTTPSYTFEAQKDSTISRFRLVFKAE